MREEQTNHSIEKTLAAPKDLNLRDLSHWAAQPPEDEIYSNYWTLKGWKAVLSSF